MTDESRRYIGDMVYEALAEIPGFAQEARQVIERDWRTGSGDFRNRILSLIAELPFEALNPSWGLEADYVACRIMGRLDPAKEPWLWTYSQLRGALIPADQVRAVLNAIQNDK